MDCARFDELLFESLDAGLCADDDERMRLHAQTCTRCRELAALLTGGSDSVRTDVPVDLIAGVLARTSGGSCERAALLLAEADGSVVGENNGLMTTHLEACTECAALAAALAQLRLELPTLAESDPGNAFVAEVMAATIGATAPQRVPLLGRIERLWERLAQRPRLAFEGAYAGLLVLFLLFGLPSQSVAQLPARALGGIRTQTVKVERTVSFGLDELVARSRATWDDSAARTERFFTASGRGPRDASRWERGLRAWGGAVRELAAAVWNQLFVPFRENLRALWRNTAPVGADRAPNR